MLAAAWAACEGPSTPAEPASRETIVPVATTAAADEITLSGRVTAAYGTHVFAVGSGRERVIVVTATPIGVSVGSNVDVTGEVRTFRRQDLERELRVDLGSASDELENASCLVASKARVR